MEWEPTVPAPDVSHVCKIVNIHGCELWSWLWVAYLHD